MALFDFLKRKKTAEKAKTRKLEKKPALVKSEEKKEEKPAAEKLVQTKKRTAGFSYEAVKQPHISEKATDSEKINQYVFDVSQNYNKQEIKKSVEGIYGVDVLSVNIVKIPAKKRRIGRQEGFRKSSTKAIVKIKEGQKIEII